VDEGELARVQEDAGGEVAGDFGESFILPGAVGFIAEDGMAEVLEMDADLVGAAGVDLGLDVGGVRARMPVTRVASSKFPIKSSLQ
jgi:hypothetical protein